jgi:acyl phosphate:glycerol-3-phosphate acyltransferase
MFFVLILIFSFLISYLIGSIPSGYWFAKYFFNLDITKNGSGNIGATNVARVLKSKKYFFIVFFLDFLKALTCLIVLAFFFKRCLEPILFMQILLLDAIFILLGNAYSVFLEFKGGKGVATSVSFIFFFFPFKLFLIFLALWFFLLFLTKQVDISSLVSFYAIAAIYYIFFPGNILYFFFILFICLWLTFRHRSNINNLFKKEKNV